MAAAVIIECFVFFITYIGSKALCVEDAMDGCIFILTNNVTNITDFCKNLIE